MASELHTALAQRSRRRPWPALGRAAAALLAVCAAGRGVSAAPPDLFDEIHVRLRAAEAKRQTIRARFTETTRSSLLVKPMVSRGTLVGAKPDHLLMDYASPERKVIRMDGKRLVLVWPDRGESEQIDVVEIMKRVNRYFVDADPGELRRSFTIRAFVDPDMSGSYQMDLLPKRKQIRQGLERLQIWITRDPLFLEQIKITFPGGDDTTVTLEDAELNVPLTANAFDVTLPPAKQR